MSDEFGEPDATAVVFAMVAATAVGDPLGAAVLVEDLDEDDARTVALCCVSLVVQLVLRSLPITPEQLAVEARGMILDAISRGSE